MGHGRKGILTEALHDGGHVLTTLSVSLLLLWIFQGVPFLAFLIGTGLVGTGLELIFKSRENKLAPDSIKDWATYQLSWIVYFGIVGQWVAVGVLTLVSVTLLSAFYGALLAVEDLWEELNA